MTSLLGSPSHTATLHDMVWPCTVVHCPPIAKAAVIL